MPSLLRHAFTAMLLLAPAPGAWAAATIEKTLTGTVTDADGHPLHHAVVKLQKRKSQLIVSYLTNRAGHYRFRRVAGDADYEVWASYHGHTSSHADVSDLNTGKNPTKDLTISLH